MRRTIRETALQNLLLKGKFPWSVSFLKRSYLHISIAQYVIGDSNAMTDLCILIRRIIRIGTFVVKKWGLIFGYIGIHIQETRKSVSDQNFIDKKVKYSVQKYCILMVFASRLWKKGLVAWLCLNSLFMQVPMLK